RPRPASRSRRSSPPPRRRCRSPRRCRRWRCEAPAARNQCARMIGSARVKRARGTREGGPMTRITGPAVTRRVAGAIAIAAALFAGGAASAQQRGGTLNSVVNPEPPMLILGLNPLLPTQLVAGKIYQGLLRYGFDLKPLPSLAKAWTISPDGKTYTFELERNVKWHDGKPFTAHDVVFSLDVMLKEVHARWRAMHDRSESIKALDDYTVEIKLKQPFSAFIFAFL